MLSAAERKIADDLLSHNLDLLRLNASMRADALKLLKALERELIGKLATGKLTEYSKAATDYLLASTKAIVQRYYDDIKRVTEQSLTGMSSTQAAAVRNALADVGYGAAIAPIHHFAASLTDVMIQGAPSAEWWSRQAQDTTFKFSNVVRQGIVQGKANGDIIKEVRTMMDVSRANAAALVQTSVQQVANTSLIDTFKANADVIKGMMQLSTLDSHTTDICMAYSGATWDLDENPIGDTELPFNGGPPRHWNCRSVLVPITRSYKELGLDVPEMQESTRSSVDGQIKANTSFDSFLERKGVKFQDEVLGQGRAQLWRDGKITLPELLDQKGNPLTLAELKQKYA